MFGYFSRRRARRREHGIWLLNLAVPVVSAAIERFVGCTLDIEPIRFCDVATFKQFNVTIARNEIGVFAVTTDDTTQDQTMLVGIAMDRFDPTSPVWIAALAHQLAHVVDYQMGPLRATAITPAAEEFADIVSMVVTANLRPHDPPLEWLSKICPQATRAKIVEISRAGDLAVYCRDYLGVAAPTPTTTVPQ